MMKCFKAVLFFHNKSIFAGIFYCYYGIVKTLYIVNQFIKINEKMCITFILKAGQRLLLALYGRRNASAACCCPLQEEQLMFFTLLNCRHLYHKKVFILRVMSYSPVF